MNSKPSHQRVIILLYQISNRQPLIFSCTISYLILFLLELNKQHMNIQKPSDIFKLHSKVYFSFNNLFANLIIIRHNIVRQNKMLISTHIFFYFGSSFEIIKHLLEPIINKFLSVLKIRN